MSRREWSERCKTRRWLRLWLYHVRQSFKPGEITPQEALEVGYALTEKFTHGKHQFFVAVNTDKQHIHCHCIFSAVNMDCDRKFRNPIRSMKIVRQISDYLCAERGLSIVENPQPSKGSYRDWQDKKEPQSNRDKLCDLIDAHLSAGMMFEQFIGEMHYAGCAVKRGKYLSFKLPDTERFIRVKSLGDDYTEDALRERCRGTRTVTPLPPANEPFVEFLITRQTSFGLLIDIQKKVAEGKGEAYENWAKVHNLKTMARTLIYLKENGIDSYDELVLKSSAVSSDFNGKLKRIKEIETRQKEITELQKYIGQYGKTREVYRLYRSQKTQKDRDDFYYAGDNVTDILLHRAAKNYFDEKGYGKNKPLPKMDALKKEWAILNSEKKTLYADYNEMKARHKNWQIAKDNCERILGIGNEEAERTAERVRQRSYSHDR